MASFANEWLYCPLCPPVMCGKHMDQKDPTTMLDCVTRNYSGCGVDIAVCPQCNSMFQISYAVKEITIFISSKAVPNV